MISASPTVVALETSSAWVIILVVSVVTLAATLLLRRLIRFPAGLPSGILLSLPLMLPLVAALAYARAIVPEFAVLKPAVSALTDRDRGLVQLLLLADDRTRVVIPYVWSGSTGEWILAIGLSVSLFMLTRRLLGALAMHRLIRRCRPLDEHGEARTLRVAKRVACAVGLQRSPALLVLPPGVSGAFAHGGRRGKILISEDLLAHLDEQELEATLAHEMAHLEAEDCRVIFTAGILRDMVAWNPIAHVAFRRLVTDREFEADRRAAAVTGNPLAVASGLLKVCELMGSRNRVGRKVAVAFLRSRGRLARRVSRLLALADGRGSVDATGRIPYLAAAFLAVSLGLLAADEVADRGGGGIAIVLGAPTTSDADLEALKRWQPLPPPKTKKGPQVSDKEKVLLAYERSLGQALVLREKDVPRWISYVTKLAKRHGISPATLRWEAQNWQARPLFSGPRIGPIGLYSLQVVP